VLPVSEAGPLKAKLDRRQFSTLKNGKLAEVYLAEGQLLAHMGRWAFNAAGFDHWPSELFQIYGLDPSGKPPTVEKIFRSRTHRRSRGSVKQAIGQILVDHRGFDFTKRIVGA